MRKTDENTRRRARDLLYGALLAAFFFSVAFAISAIFFSEMKNVPLALNSVLVLSFVSASVYVLLECCFFAESRSTAFSIGYFGSIVIFAAMTFFVSSIVPIHYLFDTRYDITAMYLRTSCVRFCLFNAVALVIRLGIETYRYIRRVFE